MQVDSSWPGFDSVQYTVLGGLICDISGLLWRLL